MLLILLIFSLYLLPYLIIIFFPVQIAQKLINFESPDDIFQFKTNSSIINFNLPQEIYFCENIFFICINALLPLSRVKFRFGFLEFSVPNFCYSRSSRFLSLLRPPYLVLQEKRLLKPFSKLSSVILSSNSTVALRIKSKSKSNKKMPKT